MSENSFGENKLQVRAKLLSAIVNLQNNSQNSEIIKATLEELYEIQDKESVLDVLTKEFLKENSDAKDLTISFLLKELIEQEKLECRFFELLASPQIKDSLKSKLISLLRECGKHVNYEQYISYFENPDEVIDSDTTKLLENAKVNPESQIDFLDFIHALPDPEKEMLVNSLAQDYDGDNLTNILIPIILSQPYSDVSQIAIKAIGESKSYLAFPILKNLYENIDDEQVKANVQKSLSILKFSGIKEDITKNYYKKMFEDSPVFKCLTSYPDGHGNMGLIFSRKNNMPSDSGFIQMFALVINDTDGIVDCFGFNEISDAEFDRILKKFYMNDRITEISPEVFKYFMTNAEKLTRLKFKEMSYEYIVWKSITNDIGDIEETGANLENCLEKIEISEFLLEKLYDENYFEKWFLEFKDSEAFQKMAEEIVEKKEPSVTVFESEIEKYKNIIFSDVFLQLIDRRLVVSAYLEFESANDLASKIMYSLTDKSPTKEEFLNDILRKSLYEYFLSQKDKYNAAKSATSIFTRNKSKDLENIDIKFIEKAINEIEKEWI